MIAKIYIESKKIEIKTLTKECLIDLHELLTKNACIIGADPVEPRGVKNLNGLGSAIDRQHTGTGDWYKYDTPFLNCATLIYGINKNHCFHNGNKRASFLAMIKHLYINCYVLKPKTSSNDLYSLILAIADKEGKIREFAEKMAKGNDKLRSIFKYVENTISVDKKEIYVKKRRPTKIWTVEEEITYIALWLQEFSISKNIQTKFRMKIGELKKILESKGLKVEYVNGTMIKVISYEEKKILFGLATRQVVVKERIYKLGTKRYIEVKKEIIDLIRQDFNLKISDGIDNVSFYDDENFIDEQLKVYKSLIYRLSKT